MFHGLFQTVIVEPPPGDELRFAAQALFDRLSATNDLITFVQAQAILVDLTQGLFDALDLNGDGQLTQVELEANGDTHPPTSSGCNGESTKTLTNLKDFFGDLFLLGLLSIVLVAWRRFSVRP